MLQIKGPERSFSAMRIVKSHLKFTVGQERLNSLMVLYVHKEYIDKTDVANEFISKCPRRQSVFRKFN